METDLRPPLLCLHSSSAPFRLILPLCITAVVQDHDVLQPDAAAAAAARGLHRTASVDILYVQCDMMCRQSILKTKRKRNHM